MLGGPGDLAIYDATKSITLSVKSTNPQWQATVTMVERNGPPHPFPGRPPGKAYFYARREGANLRVFLDKAAPLQPW